MNSSEKRKVSLNSAFIRGKSVVDFSFSEETHVGIFKQSIRVTGTLRFIANSLSLMTLREDTRRTRRWRTCQWPAERRWGGGTQPGSPGWCIGSLPPVPAAKPKSWLNGGTITRLKQTPSCCFDIAAQCVLCVFKRQMPLKPPVGAEPEQNTTWAGWTEANVAPLAWTVNSYKRVF